MSVLQDTGWPTQPQADGDGGEVYDLGTLRLPSERPFSSHMDGAVRVHVEKSGPAFRVENVGDRPIGLRNESIGEGADNRFVCRPPVVKDMLAQSLQSQSIQCVGEVLNALGRRCFLDVMPTWTRLMTLAGVSVPVHRVSPRRQWAWTEMTEAVTKALRYATQVDSKAGLIQWGEADALLRGYAMDLAVQDEAVAIDDADPRHATFLNNRAAYRCFAEGRDSWLTTKAGL